MKSSLNNRLQAARPPARDGELWAVKPLANEATALRKGRNSGYNASVMAAAWRYVDDGLFLEAK